MWIGLQSRNQSKVKCGAARLERSLYSCKVKKQFQELSWDLLHVSACNRVAATRGGGGGVKTQRWMSGPKKMLVMPRMEHSWEEPAGLHFWTGAFPAILWSSHSLASDDVGTSELCGKRIQASCR